MRSLLSLTFICASAITLAQEVPAPVFPTVQQESAQPPAQPRIELPSFNTPHSVFTPSKSSPNASSARIGDDVMTLGTPDPSGRATSRTAVIDRPRSSPSDSVISQSTDRNGETVIGQARVVDGNTLIIGGEIIVLNGADAPELNQTCLDLTHLAWRCGDKARSYLQSMIAGHAISCEIVGSYDSYLIGKCGFGNTDLAQVMIRDGLAVAVLPTLYQDSQVQAQMNRSGIWSGPFESPERFRQTEERY